MTSKSSKYNYLAALPSTDSMLATRLSWDVLHEAAKAIQRATKETVCTQTAPTWQAGDRYYVISETSFFTCHAFFTAVGKLDRDDGPAVIFQRKIPSRDRPGKIELHWYAVGARHRTDGPAVLIFDEDDQVIDEQWWQHGQLHRLDGPALFRTNAYGKPTETWYIKGKEAPALPRVAAAIRDGSSLAEALIADLARLDQEHHERIIDAYRGMLGEEAYRDVCGNFFLV